MGKLAAAITPMSSNPATEGKPEDQTKLKETAVQREKREVQEKVRAMREQLSSSLAEKSKAVFGTASGQNSGNGSPAQLPKPADPKAKPADLVEDILGEIRGLSASVTQYQFPQ